jgi:hypothetical protein
MFFHCLFLKNDEESWTGRINRQYHLWPLRTGIACDQLMQIYIQKFRFLTLVSTPPTLETLWV